MAKRYTSLLLLCLSLFAGCSKDFLKPYDERVIGTWRIADVNRIGIGGDRAELPFREGALTFNEDGSLVFVDPSGATFRGRWDIRRKQTDDGVERSMQLTAANTTTGELRSEYYDVVQFLGTDHLRATLLVGITTYHTHLRR